MLQAVRILLELILDRITIIAYDRFETLIAFNYHITN